MISAEKASEVRELLQQGLPYREIAAKTAVSRGTVESISKGKWKGKKQPIPGPRPVFSTNQYERCPGCGGLVLMPCLLCRIRLARK